MGTIFPALIYIKKMFETKKYSYILLVSTILLLVFPVWSFVQCISSTGFGYCYNFAFLVEMGPFAFYLILVPIVFLGSIIGMYKNIMNKNRVLFLINLIVSLLLIFIVLIFFWEISNMVL